MFSPELTLLIACCADQAALVTNALSAPINWRLLIHQCDAEGTLPLLSRALFRTAAAVPPEFLAEIYEKAGAKKLRSLGMAGELARILRSFEAAGLTPVAFKGPTLAYLAYGDIALRDSTDLDIYVPRRQLTTALNLLAFDGFVKKSPGFRISLPGACEVALKRRNPECEVDLHWLFSSPYFLQLDVDRAVKRSVYIGASGLRARTLCNEDLVIYLCIHAAREGWGFRSIGDLAALLRNQTIDWDDVLRESSRNGCRRAVAVGLNLAAAVLKAPAPSDVWCKVTEDPVVLSITERFINNLAADVGNYGGAPGGAVLHLKILETLGAKTGYLWRRALQPNHLDVDFVNLPDCLSAGYYLIRPVRVAYTALRRLR